MQSRHEGPLAEEIHVPDGEEDSDQGYWANFGVARAALLAQGRWQGIQKSLRQRLPLAFAPLGSTLRPVVSLRQSRLAGQVH